jgi:hypothetical protein
MIVVRCGYVGSMEERFVGKKVLCREKRAIVWWGNNRA